MWSCYDQLGNHIWSRLWSTWNHTLVWPSLWSAWSHEWSRQWITCYHKWNRLWLARNHKWTRIWSACSHEWPRIWIVWNHKWTRLWSACNLKHVWPDYGQPGIMLCLLWQSMISLFLYRRSTREKWIKCFCGEKNTVSWNNFFIQKPSSADFILNS